MKDAVKAYAPKGGENCWKLIIKIKFMVQLSNVVRVRRGKLIICGGKI